MNHKDPGQSAWMAALTYAVNLVILNLLFLLCSLPVVTCGAAASALFTMTRRLKEGETLVIGAYFRAFAGQFRQATLGWLVLLLPLVFLALEFSLLRQVTVPVPEMLYVCIVVPAAALACYLPWVLILPSYFTSTLPQQLRNALILTMKLLPQTVFMALLVAAPVVCLVLWPVTFLRMVPFWLLIYFSAAASAAVFAVSVPMENLREQLSKRAGE